MTNSLIAAMTAIALVLLCGWFSGRRIVIARTGDVFMLAWFYYGFAVALDILLGLEIQGVPGMTDFSDPAAQELLVHVLGYYLVCGAAFCFAYASWTIHPRTGRAWQSAILPPIPVIIAAHAILLLLLQRAGYFGLTRPQRILLVSESLPLRLMMLSISILRALDLVILILSEHKRHVMITSVCAICLGLATGGRMELMSVLLILVLKYRLSCSRMQFAVAAIVLLAVFACWKSVYHYVHVQITQEQVDPNGLELGNLSLSGIDSYPSSLIAVTALEEECPYLLGRSYTYDVAQAAIPKEWREPGFLPLSQAFDWDYLPQRAELGISMAYSAIAEAWLNFGWAGPLLLGLVFGVAGKVIDSRPRGIAFYVFALMTFRLFRSDFASLTKNWIVIYGGTMLACYCACMLLAYLVDRQRLPIRARQCGRRQTPIPSAIQSCHKP